mmetsp:Transcript_12460/g.11040  ORF Transcript_12460/g.11040 Transcript_12460/m.11040 type:complete len:204 (+) Transcript_12460:498-1109(+)
MIYVKGQNSTIYKNLKYMKKNEDSYYRRLVKNSFISKITVMEHFDLLKYVLVDGEMVTLAGVLTYNTKQNEFQIPSLSILSGSKSESIFSQALSEYKKFSKIILGLTVTFTALGVLFFYFSYQRDKYKKKLRNKLNEQNVYDPPVEEETCKGCYIYKKTVILIPCYHLALCELCSANFNTCPMCQYGNKKFEGKIYTKDLEIE